MTQERVKEGDSEPKQEYRGLISVAWAVNGKREETDEVLKILEEAGFVPIPIPVSGIPHPKLHYNKRRYEGVKEVKSFVDSLKPSDQNTNPST